MLRARVTRVAGGRVKSLNVQGGVNDQHVREAQSDARVGDGRAETGDQVRGSLACSVHNGTVRLRCTRR